MCHVNVNQDFYPVNKFMHIRSQLICKVKTKSEYLEVKNSQTSQFLKRMLTQYVGRYHNTIYEQEYFVSLFKSTLFFVSVLVFQERNYFSVCHSKLLLSNTMVINLPPLQYRKVYLA